MLKRLAASFRASLGDVVFGMSDGAVSIFGLVAGVSASGQDARVVVIAGATGAAAAAVSMAAGAYLDAKVSHDVAAADIDHDLALLKRDPSSALASIEQRLKAQQAAPDSIAMILDLARRDPPAYASLRRAASPAAPNPDASPLARAGWMFVADLIAATLPVLPFVFLPIAQARLASLGVMIVMMAVLGFARSAITGTPRSRTVLETMGIAGAAAVAGVAIGALFG